MFDKVKNLNKLRKAQAEIEKELGSVRVEKSKRNIGVVVNANNKIISVQIDGEEDKLMKDLINDALKEAKKKAEKKMRGRMSEFGLGDLL